MTSRYEFYRDLALSQLNLAIGRLYPNLQVPYADLRGKTAIITGGNSGIGLQVALELAKRGANVYLACRNASKAEDAVAEILSQVPSASGQVKPLSLDTSSFSSVRALAQEWSSHDDDKEWSSHDDDSKTIDLLYHNAGTGSAPAGQEFTPDGFPFIYATNFLGSFLMTHLLEEHLAPDARVIFTTSTGQYSGTFLPNFSLERTAKRTEPGFHVPPSAVTPGKETAGAAYYVNAKTMQVAFARLLHERFERKANEVGAKNRKFVHSFTPGFTMTPIFGKVTVRSILEDPLWWLLRVTTVLATHVGQGAATGVWLGTTQDEEVVGDGKGSGYWDRMSRMVSKVDIMDRKTIERLWIRWEADAGVEWR